MDNITTGPYSTVTSTTSGTPWMPSVCSTCGKYYIIGSHHICSFTPQGPPCLGCGQYGAHLCVGTVPNVVPWTTGTVSAYYTFPATFSPALKNVREVTTDIELNYILEGFAYGLLKLPSKFTDCFLKVGEKYSPLYPLIVSAFEGDAAELSFYVVTEISGKRFEGDVVVLEGVHFGKVDDNLTLLQLCESTKNYFKNDLNASAN